MIINDARSLAYTLLERYGLSHWSVKFDRAVKRFGQCQYEGQAISLSTKLTELNSKDRVEQTILHEIAHALTRGHGHDRVWRAKALAIGHKSGRRCYNPAETVLPTKEYHYKAECTCGQVHYRVKNPRKGKYYCAQSKFILSFEKIG
jgi:predicted SprT family Zn-dependent metalloprotease